VEAGNWKLETGDSKSETGHGLEFPVSSFKFRISPNPEGQGRWVEEKKFHGKSCNLLKTKHRGTK
jgi:hypothetical protein